MVKFERKLVIDRSALKNMELELNRVKRWACADKLTDDGRKALINFLFKEYSCLQNSDYRNTFIAQSKEYQGEKFYLQPINVSFNKEWHLILIDTYKLKFYVFNFPANIIPYRSLKGNDSNPDYYDIKIEWNDAEFVEKYSGISFASFKDPKEFSFAQIAEEKKPRVWELVEIKEKGDIKIKRPISEQGQQKLHDTILSELSKISSSMPQNESDNIKSDKNTASINKSKELSLENLDKNQRSVYDAIVSSNRNIFVQGRAGTGKSAIIKLVQENSSKKILYMAFTGMASEKIHGTTINSQFNLGIGINDVYNPDNYHLTNDAVAHADTIIIDEVSMLRPDLFDTVNRLCKLAKKDSSQPFGGIQIVLIGDLYQLPPIYGNSQVKTYMKEHYGKEQPFFFDSNAYKTGDFEHFTLEKMYRCDDEEMQNHLDVISKYETGNSLEKLDNAVHFFNQRVSSDSEIEKLKQQNNITILARKNNDVNDINTEKLSALEGSIVEFDAIKFGDTRSLPNITADEHLKLKKGAYVMFCRNDSEGRYVNGTKGFIVRCRKSGNTLVEGMFEAEDDCEIDVRIESNTVYNGQIVTLKPVKWQKSIFVEEGGKLVLETQRDDYIQQFPLKLAYAMTVHKAQGQTLPKELFLLDEDKRIPYEALVYVALSRVRTRYDIYLNRPLSVGDIHVNSDVRKFFNSEATTFNEPLSQPETNITDEIFDNCNKSEISERILDELFANDDNNIPVIDDSHDEIETKAQIGWLAPVQIEERKQMQGLLDNEIEQILRRYKMTKWIQGVPEDIESDSERNEAMHLSEKWFEIQGQLKNPYLLFSVKEKLMQQSKEIAEQLNRLYKRNGVKLDLQAKAERIGNFEDYDILLKKIEQKKEITDKNIVATHLRDMLPHLSDEEKSDMIRFIEQSMQNNEISGISAASSDDFVEISADKRTKHNIDIQLLNKDIPLIDDIISDLECESVDQTTPENSNIPEISSQHLSGKKDKEKAKYLCRKAGYNVSNDFTFASLNTRSDFYWANPEPGKLNQNWWLVLNDNIHKILHVFYIPSKSIKKGIYGWHEYGKIGLRDNGKLDIQIKSEDQNWTIENGKVSLRCFYQGCFHY